MFLRKQITEKGFTFIETILSLFFFMIIVSFISLFVHFVPELRTVDTVAEKEVRLFFNQLAMEIREAKSLSISDTTLELNKPSSQQITIEKYQGHIRRRVNRQGHDMFLQNIANVDFESASNGVIVRVIDHRGVEYHRRFTKMIDDWGVVIEE